MDSTTRHPIARRRARAAALLDRLWRASPPLTAVGALMIVVAGASLVAMLVDPRIITGAPAWLKPFKFAVSTAIYSLTLAWIFGWLSDWPRVRRVVGWTTAIVFVLEVAIIDAQAWRGTTSHFNVSTPLDAVLFFVMGGAILLQTLVSVAVAVALWRQRFTDRALGWALRLGMTLTIVGALTGPLMTRPTAAQLADARAGGRMTTAGAHSVGGSDGGPGVPVTGWSREHGDLRVPHFIGLHAIQALALIAVGLRRWRRPEAVRVRAVLAAAASYASLFLLLLWEALRGQSLVAPDAAALASIAIWAVVTMLVLGWIGVGSRGASRDGSDWMSRMTAEQLFSILNLMAVAAWLPLVFLPRVRWTATLLPVVVPLLLAVIYVVLVAATLPRSEGGFSSLAGVRALFDNPWALLAGWTHYLAFDLFIGGWEVRDAQRRGIPHLLIVPALVLTFLFGPAGLLLYLAIRKLSMIRRRDARSDSQRTQSR